MSHQSSSRYRDGGKRREGKAEFAHNAYPKVKTRNRHHGVTSSVSHIITHDEKRIKSLHRTCITAAVFAVVAVVHAGHSIYQGLEQTKHREEAVQRDE